MLLEAQILLELLTHEDRVHFLIIILDLQSKFGFQISHPYLRLLNLGRSKTDLIEAEDFVALPVSGTSIAVLEVLFEVSDTFPGGAQYGILLRHLLTIIVIHDLLL